MIERNIPWTSQPQHAPDIDKGNPISDGLVFSWVAANGISPEQVSGVLPTSESGITRSPTTKGIGASVAASGGINYALLPFIGIDKYTISVVASPTSVATRQHMYLSGTEASPFPQYILAANTDRNGSPAAGKFALLEYDSGWKAQAESIAGMVDGGLHTFMAVRDGTVVRLYRDGINVTGTLGTISGTHSTTTGNVSIGGTVGGPSRSGSFPILSVQAWNRALSVQSADFYGANPWQIFSPQQRNIYVSVASGGVTLTPSLFADADTFYSATVSPGAAILAPSLFADSDQFYPWAIAAGSVTLTPSLLTDADSFYSPSVAVGAVNLGPALFAGSGAFYDPSISAGAVTLEPDLFTDGDTFYASTVSTDTVVLAPLLFADTDTFHSPTVTPGAATLVPSLYVDADTFHAATVAAGGSLLPAAFTDADVFYSPSVTTGAVSLDAALFTDADSFFAPTVSPGTVDLTPSLFADSDTFYSPEITQGFALLPALFSDSETFYSPSISVGSVTLAPSLFADGDIFYAPAVAAIGSWPGEVVNMYSPITMSVSLDSPISKKISFNSYI